MRDLDQDRTVLLSTPNYIASSAFLPSIGWRRNGGGNVLVDKNAGNSFLCIAVGTIVDDKLFCGPTGNFSPEGLYPKPMKDAKVSFLLGRPLHSLFAIDFDTSVKRLSAVQAKTSMTDDHRYLIDHGNCEPVFKFSAPIFEALEDGDDAVPDDVTQSWPVPKNHRGQFDAIKEDYKVLPLVVWGLDNKRVPPTKINKALRNVLAEVHFHVKHFVIRRPGEPTFDSYTGVVQQITILHSAPPKDPNPYLTLAGPFRPSASLHTPSSSAVASSVASVSGTSTENAFTSSAGTPPPSSFPTIVESTIPSSLPTVTESTIPSSLPTVTDSEPVRIASIPTLGVSTSPQSFGTHSSSSSLGTSQASLPPSCDIENPQTGTKRPSDVPPSIEKKKLKKNL